MKSLMKILIIDDDKKTADKMAEYLQMLGNAVVCGYDGLEGYKLYKEHAPHLVVLDLNLPVLHGMELLKRIRKKDSRTKVVILSAHSEKEWKEEAIKNHVSDYIIKPIRRRGMEKMVQVIKDELNKEVYDEAI